MNSGSPQHQNQFCVRWNSHLGSIGASFPLFLAGQHFVDVTLACEGHQLHCHRLVLASCSTFFNSLLRENPCKHPIIILPPEIKLWEIQALIDFMYKGEVNVSQSGLEALLKSAAILQIRGLSGVDTMFNLNHVTNPSNDCAGVSSASSPIPSSTSPITNGTNAAKHLMPMNLNEQMASQSSGNNSAIGGCGSPGSPLLTNETGLVSNNDNASGLVRNFRKSNEQHESGHSSPSSASSPVNQSADINNSRQDPQIKKRTSSAFGSGGIGDDDGMSLMQQQANNGLLCDEILTPKEEPVDVNAEVSMEEDINVSSNEPLEGQDGDSYVGPYSYYFNRSKKQEMLQHRRNQTEQQVQEQDYEQNNRVQNNNNNNNIENILQQFKQRNNDNKNVVIIKNEINNVNNNYFNGNNNNNNYNDDNDDNDNGNDQCINIVKTFSSNSKSKTKKMKLCDNNNGNESDSSSYSVVIIENEVPMIEIFDNDDDDDGNDEEDRNSHFVNDNLNTDKMNVTKKIVMQEATVTKDQNKNRNNSGRIRVKSSENLFENLSYGGMNGNITIRRQQQQRREVKLPLNNSNRPSSSSSSSSSSMLSLLPKSSHSKSNGKLLESRNQMLPSSLKFDSQSMAIYVKPAVSISETCTISNSSSTLNSSSLVAYLKGTGNNSYKTSQEQQQQAQQQQQKRSSHRNVNKKTQIKVKNDIEINDTCNYENIICAPNVSDFCNNEFVPSYEYVKVNFDDIHIDENFYNLNSEYSEISNAEELSESSLSVNEYWKRLSKQQTSDSRSMKTACSSSKTSETKTTTTNIRKTATNNNNRSLLRNTNTTVGNNGSATSTTSTMGGGKNNNNLSSLMNCLPNGVPSPSAVVLRNPRSNQPRSYSTDALYAALMDVKGGESIYRASQIHKVPRKTLRNWMKRWHIKSAYPMPRQLKQAAEKKKLKQMKNEK